MQIFTIWNIFEFYSKSENDYNISYSRSDGGYNLVTKNSLESHSHITAPELEYIKCEYFEKDIQKENISEAAVTRFFLCKGDHFICHENCYVRCPYSHKQKTKYRVE